MGTRSRFAAKAKAKRRTIKKQKGGYYPSVFEGVRNAYYILPIALRQGYRLLNSKTTVRHRKTRKR